MFLNSKKKLISLSFYNIYNIIDIFIILLIEHLSSKFLNILFFNIFEKRKRLIAFTRIEWRKIKRWKR